MTELELLKKPEYIHVVLNHLPIYGTILGALALAISLILQSRAAQITAQWRLKILSSLAQKPKKSVPSANTSMPPGLSSW
jgi:hypothetical protein